MKKMSSVEILEGTENAILSQIPFKVSHKESVILFDLFFGSFFWISQRILILLTFLISNYNNSLNFLCVLLEADILDSTKLGNSHIRNRIRDILLSQLAIYNSQSTLSELDLILFWLLNN